MDYASVKIWGEEVGAVTWDDRRQLASFQYTRAFVKNGWELSPFHLPLNASRIYEFPNLRSRPGQLDTFKGLPGLLADSLPDNYGNQLIDRWLSTQGRKSGSMTPVEKLCFIGKRGMGALEFEPATKTGAKESFKIELDGLVKVAQQVLDSRNQFGANLSKDEEKALTEIIKVSTSAGGARAKAVIAYNSKTGEIKSGQTNAPKGFEHWIIKLDGVQKDEQLGVSKGFGRVEMAYYDMATDCGIEMMPSQLLEENGRAHFMTKRFDRETDNSKHHIQTFCAMKHYDYQLLNSFSYEQLFETMRELKLSYPDYEQMFRRMVFNVMATNWDDHTKNFSFMLKKGAHWQLAPAYDVRYSYDPKNAWVNQHSMSINGKHKDINQEDLLTLARSIGSKKGQKIINKILSVVNEWEHYANKHKVSDGMKSSINSTLVSKSWKE